jgi:hypothetical protein
MTTPTVASIRASLGEGIDGESIRRLARMSEADPPEGAVVLAVAAPERRRRHGARVAAPRPRGATHSLTPQHHHNEGKEGT